MTCPSEEARYEWMLLPQPLGDFEIFFLPARAEYMIYEYPYENLAVC